MKEKQFKGYVYKLAEIMAATVLAGRLTLAKTISAPDQVSSHEQYVRNWQAYRYAAAPI